MPEMPVQQRAQGAYVRSLYDPHDGGPCGCDWSAPKSAAQLLHRSLPTPDQSRYGAARFNPDDPDKPSRFVGRGKGESK